jgi:hypothetical protein
MKPDYDFSELAKMVTELLRKAPSIGGLRNALHHMWGHVSDYSYTLKGGVELWSLSRLMEEIQLHSLASKDPYLTSSTALSELKAWISNT